MKIDVKGDVVSNGDEWIYDWLGCECASPRKVLSGIEKAAGEPLDVYVNSGGGDIFAGSEIYEALRGYRGQVRVHVVGVAASAASVIACARESDIAPTGMVMVHNVSSSAQGDHNAMDKSSELLKKADRAIAAAYVAKTGKPEKDVLSMMDRETWMTAQDAVDAGLIDAVSTPGALVAAGPGTVPREVIDKIRATVQNPFAKGDGTHRKAKAKLEFLRLKGART